MKSTKDDQILVFILGMGNPLLGDDGVGGQGVGLLSKMPLPQGVVLVDAGTGLLDYLEPISRTYRLIALDAVRGGGPPGSLYRLAEEDLRQQACQLAHGFTLPDVLALSRLMTGYPKEVTIFGVEPFSMEWGTGLSPVVQRALPALVQMIMEEVRISKQNPL